MFASGMRKLWPSLDSQATMPRNVLRWVALAIASAAYGGGAFASDPVARFVSLKADRLDVRAGPGPTHKVAWVFQRAGLPVEVLGESNGWREIRDVDGAVGWVQARHLSLRRTVIITGIVTGTTAGVATVGGIALKARASDGADTLLLTEPGIVANLVACDGLWCQVGLADIRGFLPQNQLWGVLKGEIVK